MPVGRMCSRKRPMNVVPGNRTVLLPPASLARTVRSIRSSKAPKASSNQQCPTGAVHGLGQKLPCSTTACQSWCRHGTRCTGVTPHALRQGASHRQDSRDVLRRANAAHGAGLVQQTDQSRLRATYAYSLCHRSILGSRLKQHVLRLAFSTLSRNSIEVCD